MKTFKQHIQEKYVQLMKFSNEFFKDTTPLFKNPSKKEIDGVSLSWGYRGFLMDNGDMYVWDGGVALHNEMAKRILKGNKNYIPISGNTRGMVIRINISTDIKYTSNKGQFDKNVEKVYTHKHLLKIYIRDSFLDVNDSGYVS